MANNITTQAQNLFGGNALAVPDYIKGMELGVTSNLMQGMATGGDRIGLKGSRFRLIVAGIEEGVIEEPYLDVIFLGAAPSVSRVYYEGAYVPGENQPPTCYSADGIRPADDVKHKQSDLCATCKWNVKGSKIVNGQKYKACGYFRRLVVMLAGDVDDRRVFKLDVKGQGLFAPGNTENKNLNDYIKMIATRGVEACAVVTRVSFDIDASVPKLLFRAVRYVTPEEMGAVSELVTSDDVKMLKDVTMNTLDVSDERPTGGDEPQAASREAAHKPQVATVQAAHKLQVATVQAARKPQVATVQAAHKLQVAVQKPRVKVESAVPPPAARPVEAQEVVSVDELSSILDGLE